jgi:periplasmic protein TonB
MAVATYKPAKSGRFPRWGYLDKFYTNDLMPRAFVATLVGGALLYGAWAGGNAIRDAISGRKKDAHGPMRKRTVILTTADLTVPPSLTEQQQVQMKVEVKTRPAVAKPKPVADELAVEETIATSEEMSAMGQTTNESFGEGDSLVVDTGGGLPGPEDYVAYEKEPELVSPPQPVYPDIAREAGVEGTVLVRVLVGEDGFVKEQMIVQSVPMLDEAAAQAAADAVFKPALQKDKPVAVWMVIPIEFQLRN